METFRADRGREDDELTERCGAFVTEISKDTQVGKVTVAELEESEQDLEKLERWLGKIEARDIFPDEGLPQSHEMVERCHQALENFSRAVYEAEGIEALDDDAA